MLILYFHFKVSVGGASSSEGAFGGRSASFMNMLPSLAESFNVSVSQLMDIPISAENADLSEDEIKLLSLYRRSRPLPVFMRNALAETLETTIKLYINSYAEAALTEKKKPKARK